MITSFIGVIFLTTGINYVPIVHINNNYFPSYSTGLKSFILNSVIVSAIMCMIPFMASVTIAMQFTSTYACNVIQFILPNFIWLKMIEEKHLRAQ